MSFEVDGFLQATDEFNKLARKQENKIELTLHPQKEENTEKLVIDETQENEKQPTTGKNQGTKSLTDSDYKPDVIPEYNVPKGSPKIGGKRYHISDDLVPRLCSAEEGNCPYGGLSTHYDSIAEAQSVIDDRMLKQEFKQSYPKSRIKSDNASLDNSQNSFSKFTEEKTVKMMPMKYYNDFALKKNYSYVTTDIRFSCLRGGKSYDDSTLNEFTDYDAERMLNIVSKVIDDKFIKTHTSRLIREDLAFSEELKQNLENYKELTSTFNGLSYLSLGNHLSEFFTGKATLRFKTKSSSVYEGLIITTKDEVDNYIKQIDNYFGVFSKGKVTENYNETDDKYSSTKVYQYQGESFLGKKGGIKEKLGFSTIKKISGIKYKKKGDKEATEYDLYCTAVEFKTTDWTDTRPILKKKRETSSSYKMFLVPKGK